LILLLTEFESIFRIHNAYVSGVLTKWGLLPRFKRWRLTQDPGTGMIVLFGILNNRYIATHTSIPFSDYFDPRLLHDLSNELQVQVVSCNSDGLRYAFILERGSLTKVPTHIDYPFLDGERVSVRVIFDDQPAPPPDTPILTTRIDVVDDKTLVEHDVVAFLDVFDDINLKDEISSKLSVQGTPDVIRMDEEEFKKLVAEHKIIWQKSHPN
jgi:hypothetical protein